jgi:signal transduction histidine kinase
MDLISTALAQRERRGVGELLRGLCEAMGAHGCAVWEAAELGEPKRYAVLGQWMRDGSTWAIYSLTADSPTGRAAAQGRPVFVKKANEVPALGHLVERGIASMCALPLKASGGGVLEFYWTSAQPFDEAQRLGLGGAAETAGALLESIADKVSYNLLGRLNDLLRLNPAGAADSESAMSYEPFPALAAEIAKALGCLEVSIFLEDRLEKRGSFDLRASTCPELVRKKSYLAGESGPTGWVLRNARPVRIFDLFGFERDGAEIDTEHPGLSWRDWGVRSAIAGLLDRQPGPLCFIAAPILDRSAVIGAIRCCCVTDGHFYLSRRELKLLELVAAQTGHYWANALSSREMALSNNGWRRLVESIIRLNQFAHQELQKKNPDEGEIFAEGLRVTKQAIQGADILDVRLIDDDGKELYFARTEGVAWKTWSKEQLAQFRYPVDGEPSAGAFVYNTQEVLYSEDLEKLKPYRKIFPEVKRIICAPITAAKTRFGVIGICGTGAAAFHPDAPTFAQLLSGQLGLYHSLAITINRLNAHVATQAQANVDLHHQLRSPIAQARKRIQELADSDLPSGRAEYQVAAIRGLLRKANGVVHNLRLFTDLAEGKPLQARPTPTEAQDVARRFQRAAVDHRLLIADRGIRFEVDQGSFGTRLLKVDTDLLEQAADILLDNSFKYSFPETTIRIRGGVDVARKRFYVVVENEGIVLSPEEANRAGERGFRSRLALRVTGEGTGLGLHILKHIMKAHEGEMDVHPTDSKGITSVWLWFPLHAGGVL